MCNLQPNSAYVYTSYPYNRMQIGAATDCHIRHGSICTIFFVTCHKSPEPQMPAGVLFVLLSPPRPEEKQEFQLTVI